jgi:RNA polymerase sigma factor (sigma-70 family)
MQTDAHVLRQAQIHPWMFGILVDRYQKLFLKRARRILRSESLAEDAVQDTFVKIYQHGSQFTERRGASFSSWSYRILTNTCYDYATRAARETERVKHEEFDTLDAMGAGNWSSGEEVSLVRSVLVRLPERLSRLLHLYFFEEKSYEEIALAENVSLSAVKSGLHRAKRQFKEVATTLN